ncbi:MAG: hypothetical protein Q8Q03_02745 [bacterium]|nr:hypothetical protein [bacterium]
MDRNKKNVVQDVIPSGRRSIRRVPARQEEPSVRINRVRSIPPRPRKRRLPGAIVSFLVIFLGIAVIAVALSLLYSKASVTITPKTAKFDVKGTFTAKKGSGSPLAYDVITLSDSAQQSIPATDGPLVQTKAKGTVYLYNAQKVQQKIVAGTRLSNSKGLVYRTVATVTIPAGGSSPGSVSIGVLADQAGSQYDMQLGTADPNLKVVAYKGGDKYTTVYGKIKTSIEGGFSGNKKVISPAVREATIESLKETLETKLVSQLKAKVPRDSVMYESAYSIEYETPEPVSGDKDTAIISAKGIAYGVTLKRDPLFKSIVGKELDNFAAPTYRVDKLEDLAFTIVNAKDFSPKKGTPLIFNLKGPILVVGTFSEEDLKNELKGTYLKQSNSVFAHYPSIANAYALITPFWMRSFPNSPDKIGIEIKN